MSFRVSAFKLLESSSQQWLQGLVYLIGNLLGSALAIYKCQSMGLLPTHSSDWLAFIEPPQVWSKLYKVPFEFLQKYGRIMYKIQWTSITPKQKKNCFLFFLPQRLEIMGGGLVLWAFKTSMHLHTQTLCLFNTISLIYVSFEWDLLCLCFIRFCYI